MENDELQLVKNQDVLLQDILDQLRKAVSKDQQNLGDQTALNDLIGLINEFQINPQLLDRRLPEYVGFLAESYRETMNTISPEKKDTHLSQVSTVFYNFCKIRGMELVSSLLPTDVHLLIPIFTRAKSFLLREATGEWHETALLVLWLSVLVLCPFPLDLLLDNGREKLYDLCGVRIAQASYLADVHVLFVLRFLVRSDTAEYLRSYYSSLDLSSVTSGVFNLKLLLKIVSSLSPEFLNTHWSLLSDSFTILLETGLENVSPGIVRLLVDNIALVAPKLMHHEKYDAVEEAIANLLQTIESSDTGIRVSASSGIARIAALLPEDFQNQVLELVLVPGPVDFTSTLVNEWHGRLLVVAELLRRQICRDVQTIGFLVSQFLFFQKNQANLVLTGSSIRDVTLYIVWSLMKYNPGLVKEDPQVGASIFMGVLFAGFFDPDLIIRRASSAVAQEIVGRYGLIVWRQLGVLEDDARAFSLRVVELLEFGKLNDYRRCYLETSKQLIGMIPLQRRVLYDYLLSERPTVYKDFSITNCKTGVYSIDKTLAKFAGILLGSLMNEEEDIAQDFWILDSLEKGLQKADNTGVLYAISELFSKSWRDEIVQKRLGNIAMSCLSVIGSTDFDFHRDPSFKGEALLHLINTSLCYWKSVSRSTLELVFNIIRQNDPMIVEKFETFLTVLGLNISYLGCQEAKFLNEKISYYIRNGNLVSSRSVGYLTFLYLEKHLLLTQITEIIGDKKKPYELRLNLLHSMGVLHKREQKIELLPLFISNLSDYTQTEQGDVGNKLRYECVSVVSENNELVAGHPEHRNDAEKKLLGLVCEAIDRVKYSALKALMSLKGKSLQKVMELIENNDYFQYYLFLLDFYLEEYLHDEPLKRYAFLSGLALCAGSTSGANMSARRSLEALIYTLDTTSEKEKVIADLMFLVKKSPLKEQNYNTQRELFFDHNEKVRLLVLNLIARLVEGGVDLLGNDPELMAKRIFVRVYNYEISTTSFSSVANIIRIYGYLASNGMYYQEVMKRYTVMLKKYRKKELVIKKLFQALYEVYTTNLSVKDRAKDAVAYILDTDIEAEIDVSKVIVDKL